MKAWVRRTLIECYLANGDQPPAHLLDDQEDEKQRSRRTWSRYESERQDQPEQKEMECRKPT